MADATLILLAKEIRGKTLKLLDGLSDEQARFAAPGLNNTILWHAGHGVMLMEHLGIMPLTGSQQDGLSRPAGTRRSVGRATRARSRAGRASRKCGPS